MSRGSLHLFVILPLLLLLYSSITHAGCASAPPNLSPAGISAYNNTRIIKGLDVLRDTAESANNQIPPRLSTTTTRKIVQYHESAVKTIRILPSGWVPAVWKGLDETMKNLPPGERQLLAPYVALLKGLMQEIAK